MYVDFERNNQIHLIYESLKYALGFASLFEMLSVVHIPYTLCYGLSRAPANTIGRRYA